jgi:dihydrofolate reductase
MSKVFVNVGLSLDGYIAPEGMDMAHADDPNSLDWMAKWTELQNWVTRQEMFRQNLGLGEGGETGRDNDILRETFDRTGVSIMGKRMFEGGERFWPEEAPFHTPVFVLIHEERQPWERPGGTTFHFVNEGMASAGDTPDRGLAVTLRSPVAGGMVSSITEVTLWFSPSETRSGQPRWRRR